MYARLQDRDDTEHERPCDPLNVVLGVAGDLNQRDRRPRDEHENGCQRTEEVDRVPAAHGQEPVDRDHRDEQRDQGRLQLAVDVPRDPMIDQRERGGGPHHREQDRETEERLSQRPLPRASSVRRALQRRDPASVMRPLCAGSRHPAVSSSRACDHRSVTLTVGSS